MTFVIFFVGEGFLNREAQYFPRCFSASLGSHIPLLLCSLLKKSGKPWLIHQGLKSLVFSSVKLWASQARMLIIPLQPIFTGHIRLLDVFIMLQLPYPLSYEAMFVKAPRAY